MIESTNESQPPDLHVQIDIAVSALEVARDLALRQQPGATTIMRLQGALRLTTKALLARRPVPPCQLAPQHANRIRIRAGHALCGLDCSLDFPRAEFFNLHAGSLKSCTLPVLPLDECWTRKGPRNTTQSRSLFFLLDVCWTFRWTLFPSSRL